MRLPSISIEYVEEESYAIGKLSWSFIVAFALHWAWVFLAMYSSVTILGINDSSTFALFPSSSATLGLTLLAYAVFFKRLRQQFATAQDRKKNRTVGAGACAIGTLFLLVMVLLGATGIVAFVLALVGGILTGYGSAILLMSLGVSSSICDVPTVSTTVALGSFLSFIVFGVILTLDNLFHPIGAIVCVFLPLLELACLNIDAKDIVDKLHFGTQTLPVSTPKLARYLVPMCMLFALMLSIMRSQIFFEAAALCGNEEYFLLLTLLAAVCSTAVILITVLLARQKQNFMMRVCVPICAICFALLLSDDINSSSMAFPIMGLAYLCLESCIWILLADVSQRYRISPFYVFGLGRGSMAIAACIVCLLTLPDTSLHHFVSDMTVLAPVGLVLLCLGFSSVPEHADILCALKRGQNCPAFYELEEESPALEAKLEQSLRDFEEQHTPLPAEEDVSAPAEPTTAVDEPAIEKLATDAEVPVPAAETPAPVVEASAEKPAEVPEPMDDKELVEKLLAPLPEGSDSGNGTKLGRFKRRCVAVADTYLLSRRETEVLFLLAKGFSGSMIQEHLYISEGTVNTHTRHIYRKLDVHSQRELIRLVETFNENR